MRSQTAIFASVPFPKKHLGQIFLKDKNTIDRIINACRLGKDDVVFEIGPGPGTLTRHIAPLVKELMAIETDKGLCQQLQEELEGQPVKIIHADILKFKFETLPHNLICIGNLPYYISSPIMAQLIENRRHFKRIFIMVQWEFGNRMIAKIHTKDYSALTCYIRYYTDCQMLFKVGRFAFQPIPKVDSCFMQLDFKKETSQRARDELMLFKIIRAVFQQRRKTIANALSQIAGKDHCLLTLAQLKIKPNLRPENLTLENFVNICNSLTDGNKP